MINTTVQILEKKQKGRGSRLMLMQGEAGRDEDEERNDQMSAMIPRR
jgi:hypothetical protein